METGTALTDVLDHIPIFLSLQNLCGYFENESSVQVYNCTKTEERKLNNVFANNLFSYVHHTGQHTWTLIIHNV